MNVLVTGATGFLGPALIDALLAGGWRVMALARDSLSARGRFGDRVLVLESLDHLPTETRIDANFGFPRFDLSPDETRVLTTGRPSGGEPASP